MRYKPYIPAAAVMIVCALITSFVIIRHSVKTANSYDASKRRTVVLDAGHGGEDGGASGPGGIMEKGINLNISRAVSDLLGFYGVNTAMTRTEDISLHSEEYKRAGQRKTSDIKNRVKRINEMENAVLISIHLNSFPNKSSRGAQVFYSKNNPLGEVLAKTVQNTLKEGISDGNKRLAKQSDDGIYILKHVDCPAVLVECGFLSNTDEAKKLMSEAYQRKIAVCITAGYMRFSAGHENGESPIISANSSY